MTHSGIKKSDKVTGVLGARPLETKSWAENPIYIKPSRGLLLQARDAKRWSDRNLYNSANLPASPFRTDKD